MKTTQNDHEKRPGISWLLIPHLLCCGLLLLALFLGGSSLVVVLGYVEKSLVPGGMVLILIALIWGGLRLWKKRHL